MMGKETKMKNIIVTLIIMSAEMLFGQQNIKLLNKVPESFKRTYFEQKHEYNPLHVGDIWQYGFDQPDGTLNYYTTRVVHDSIINGKKYFKKIDWRFEARPPLSHVKFISWERNDSISGASCMLDFEDIDDDGDSTEEFLLDSLIISDHSYYDSYKYSFKNDINFSFVGKKTASLSYTYWSIVYGDTVLVKIVEYLELFITEQIADKFGIVSMRRESPDHFLTGAIINGVKYGVIVSVENDISELPKYYKLYSNYPNPFNNATKITYQLPSRTKVKLIITDILGRVIKILVDEEKKAGVYQANFTAKNLSSGVYFCSLVINNNISTIKMIYLK